jgi:hypothetical protein
LLDALTHSHTFALSDRCIILCGARGYRSSVGAPVTTSPIAAVTTAQSLIIAMVYGDRLRHPTIRHDSFLPT